ncbi:OadG family protein [Carnobacterium funditum]|uniref:OadG family protein n=1 Tax=Carnobacterium funditum TaxID=2752 RepID=UPI000555ACA2|nr:OadG family protein [Carnobacterium funditum]
MTSISLLEGINISITSIVMVFLVLFGLQLILISFKYIFKEENSINKEKVVLPIKKDPLEEDEETKTVAALTALVLANEDQQDKYYQVTSIKRIR